MKRRSSSSLPEVEATSLSTPHKSIMANRQDTQEEEEEHHYNNKNTRTMESYRCEVNDTPDDTNNSDTHDDSSNLREEEMKEEEANASPTGHDDHILRHDDHHKKRDSDVIDKLQQAGIVPVFNPLPSTLLDQQHQQHHQQHQHYINSATNSNDLSQQNSDYHSIRSSEKGLVVVKTLEQLLSCYHHTEVSSSHHLSSSSSSSPSSRAIQTAVMTPPPKGVLVQCRIIRSRGDAPLLGSWYPRYQLVLEDDGECVMCSKKRMKNKTSNYQINACSTFDKMSRKAHHYVGKV
ncbi:hypothetical protein FOZ63_006574, partial [Perkinsus olseni]